MKFEQIKNLIDMVDDPVEKLEIVLDLGKNLPVPPADSECNEIVGCTSVVHICRRGNEFYGTADSKLVAGILTIILSMVDGHSIDEIRNMPIAQMFADLKINIGASRLNGVNSMIRFLKNL